MSTITGGKNSPWYEMLKTTPQAFHALRSEPRVSYTIYVPPGFMDDPDGYSLLVCIHGSGRNATKYRDAFKAFADEHKFVVLAPLFPVGIHSDGYSDGYKNVLEKGSRYDLMLLDMVADIEEAFNYNFGKFYLFGFSGGGQFVHRFYYLHPERLAAVSICAPGAVTRIDNTRNWWLGTKDLADRFGIELDLDAMREVNVQMVVGDRDLEEFIIPDSMAAFIKDLGDIGRNRVERLALLKDNYNSFGIDVQFELVSNVAHEGVKMVGAVEKFFLSVSV